MESKVRHSIWISTIFPSSKRQCEVEHFLKETNWVLVNSPLVTNCWLHFSKNCISDSFLFFEKIEVKKIVNPKRNWADLTRRKCGLVFCGRCVLGYRYYMLDHFESGVKLCTYVSSQITIEFKNFSPSFS